MIQLHISIQCQKAGQYIGKSETGKNTASYRSAVSHLHANDISGTFPENTIKIPVQPLMGL